LTYDHESLKFTKFVLLWDTTLLLLL